MLSLAFLFILGMTPQAPAGRPVTGEQLLRLLADAHGQPDKLLAQQVADLYLTERLSPTTLAECETNSPGPMARQALTTVADMAAFLDLPPSRIPDTPRPEVATQRAMLAKTVSYVTETVHQLPNFLAVRETTSFQGTPWHRTRTTDDDPALHRQLLPYQLLHLVDKYSSNVLYRRGEEVVHANAVSSHPSVQGLTTSGEFGSVLGTVMLDAAQSNLSWSHWEQGANGLEAVFQYSVTTARSHYQVGFCCTQTYSGQLLPYQEFTGYHGEIAVDPANGTVLRLALKADLKPNSPMVRADILVEYGPVTLGGKLYICPVKSVALSLAHQLQTDADPDLLQTSLNEVNFVQYRLFRSDAHILP